MKTIERYYPFIQVCREALSELKRTLLSKPIHFIEELKMWTTTHQKLGEYDLSLFKTDLEANSYFDEQFREVAKFCDVYELLRWDVDIINFEEGRILLSDYYRKTERVQSHKSLGVQLCALLD